MCKQCQQRRENEAHRRKLKLRVEAVHSNLFQLLTVDNIKGSEYVNLLEMSNSSDLENLVVVEEIINSKIK